MADRSIRNVDDRVKQRLRVRAARHGRDFAGTGVDVFDPWSSVS